MFFIICSFDLLGTLISPANMPCKLPVTCRHFEHAFNLKNPLAKLFEKYKNIQRMEIQGKLNVFVHVLLSSKLDLTLLCFFRE